MHKQLGHWVSVVVSHASNGALSFSALDSRSLPMHKRLLEDCLPHFASYIHACRTHCKSCNGELGETRGHCDTCGAAIHTRAEECGVVYDEIDEWCSGSCMSMKGQWWWLLV